MKERSNKGGKREGAGRKPLPFKVKAITVRVPLHKATEAKQILKKLNKDWLAEYIANQ